MGVFFTDLRFVVHGVLVVDRVGLRGGRRSGVEAWTKCLSWRVARRVVCCFMCVEQLKSCVLFYVCRATKELCAVLCV